MNQRGDTCRCAQEYAERWPSMTPAELALVHDPECPVRLRRLRRGTSRERRSVRSLPLP